MNDISLDLHGLTEEEAIPELSFKLMDFEMNDMINTLTIIPGKGTGAMSQIVGDYLDEEGIDYHTDEYGNYIIQKYDE